MNDSIMLYNGKFVPVSFVSDSNIFDPMDPNMLFFDNGRLKRFKKGKNAYMALFDSNEEFVGYFLEERFWYYNLILDKNRNEFATVRPALGEQFTFLGASVKNDSRVFFSYKFIYKEGLDFELIVNYGFKLREALNPTSTIDSIDSPELKTVSVFNDVNTYGRYILEKKFLNPDKILSALSSDDRAVLFDVVYVLDVIFKDEALKMHLKELGVFEVFEAHLNLPKRYGPANGKVEKSYHQLYDSKYFSLLRLKLIEFRYWLLQYKGHYEDLDDNSLIVYMVNMFSVEELSSLPYSIKMKLLDVALKDDWVLIGDWEMNQLNEEKAVLKIIRSIYREIEGIPNYGEIDTFMDRLNSIYDNGGRQTLYTLLYGQIDDDLLLGDNGKGNLGQFVMTIYNLWKHSKYNPNHEKEETALAALDKFSYTPFTATGSPNLPTGGPGFKYDESAAPLMLSYVSEKGWIWYCDNLDFTFLYNKIKVNDNRYGPVGFYSIFQPVCLMKTNSIDNIINFPFKGISEVTSPLDLEFIENSFPVFLLKYIDDAGEYSDAKETLGLVLDVVLTFTGIGNLSKLGHYRHLSKLRLLSSIDPLEKVFVLEALTGAFGAVEITASVCSTVLYYVTNSCSDPVFCEKLNYWLFALEVASLSGDLLTKRALRRSARDVVEHIPDGGWPVGFTDNTNPRKSVSHTVEKIADVVDAVKEFRNKRLSNYTRLSTEFDTWSTSKQRSFFDDFESQTNQILKRLNDEVDLFNVWKSNDIVHLPLHKKNLDFLAAYHRFTIRTWEVEHITTLIHPAKFDPKGGHWIDIIRNGDALELKHLLDKPTTSTQINGHIRYRNLYFPRPSKYVTGGIEIPPGSGDWYKRKGLQYIINPTWDVAKLKEEMAYAFSHKIHDQTLPPLPAAHGQTVPCSGVAYLSTFSDGTPVGITIRNYQIDPVTEKLKFDHLSLLSVL